MLLVSQYIESFFIILNKKKGKVGTLLKYTIKRLLLLIPILFLVSLLVFCLVRMMPGSAEMAYLKEAGIPPSDAALTNAAEELGLNRPFVEQYVEWFKNALRLDFGTSYITKKEVRPEMLGALKNTMQLAFCATVIILVISIPMGIVSAVRANKELDNMNRILAFLGSSMPSFWLGPLLVQLFCLKLGWLPVQGMNNWKSLVLPSITLAVLYIAMYSRSLRNSLLENVNKRFVMYSRARGISEKKIITNHVLRTSLIPAVTTFGVNFGHMMAGSAIIEVLFSWPGLGRLCLGAVNSRDFPMIQGYVMVMAVVFILVNLLTDLVTVALDPRMRETL